jgi:hypothetical protein
MNKLWKGIADISLEQKTKGLVLDPKEDSFDCWVDASHTLELSSSAAI